jgi:CSLREA domain-containing protein
LTRGAARRPVVAIIYASLAVLGIDTRAFAAEFTVTSLADDGDGICATDCTLREAVAQAGPTDTVRLPAGHYVLEQGPLVLQGDTIAGAGARTTTIDGQGGDRVLQSTVGVNRVSGVTVTGGRSTGAGGGILLQRVDPPVQLDVVNVTVTGNAAAAGGGIANIGGALNVIRSTVSRNRVDATQGAPGGGFHLNGGTTTLSNSTVSANIAHSAEVPDAAGGGLYILGGTVEATNVTFAGNEADDGSAIHRDTQLAATVTLTNTIVAGTGFSLCRGGPFGGSRNLVAQSSCGAPVGDARLGALADNGGPTDTHALGAGSPAIDGGSGCETTDQRGFARHAACDIGAYEAAGAAPPPGGGGGGGGGGLQLPPPVAGKRVNALTKEGTVKIKQPGTKKFTVLGAGRQIRVGTVIDARKGAVTLVVAANRSGGTWTGVFYDGMFKLGQTKKAKPLTTLTLVEKLTGCTSQGKATTAKKKARKRRLWGDGKGRFRTRGKRSAATVVGTKWLVEDRCSSTLTRVARGKVKVRDFVKKKTVTVTAGHKYVARAKR